MEGEVDCVTKYKYNRFYQFCTIAFSLIILMLHMAALGFVYRSLDVLLNSNDITSKEAKKLMLLQADNLKRYSGYFTNGFFISCYLFFIFTGVVLLLRKIKLKDLLIGDIIFCIIQVIGIGLFIQLFNVYGLTEGYGRLRTIFRHELLWFVIIVPIVIRLLYDIVRNHNNHPGKNDS